MKQEIKELKKRIAELEARLAEQPTQWEPEGGDWATNTFGEVENLTSFPSRTYFGAERPTKELAERAAVAMRKFNRLLAYRDEVCPDYEPDWSNSGEYKFTVYYDHEDRIWAVARRDSFHNISVIYFPSAKIAQELCDKLNAGVVVL